MYDPNSKLKTQEKEESEGGRKIPELPCSSLPTFWVEIFSEFREFSPYANFITVNFVTADFKTFQINS